MKAFLGIPVAFLTLALLALGQDARHDDIKTLIANLTSNNYKVREAANKQLRERPDAEASLRDAMRSFDLETRRRASEILEHFERRCVSELNKAVETGRADKFLDMMSNWPKGKYEEEVWPAMRKFASAVLDKHERLGGEKLIGERLRDVLSLGGGRRKALRAEKITRGTKADFNEHFLLWAHAVDLDYSTQPEVPQNHLAGGLVIISSGPVRANDTNAGVSIIFARGDFEINGRFALLGSTLVVCAGSVDVGDLFECLVIARGKVSCGNVRRSRVISGQKVDLGSAKDSIITENEPNPLGFIRWSDPPKDKTAPKAK